MNIVWSAVKQVVSRLLVIVMLLVTGVAVGLWQAVLSCKDLEFSVQDQNDLRDRIASAVRRVPGIKVPQA